MQISHGEVSTSAPNLLKNFGGYGIEGAINFNEINATSDLNQDRQPCLTGGSMLLLSQDEINRPTNDKARNFFDIYEEALPKTFLAGVDTRSRRCGNFNANEVSSYVFTKEISAFEAHLRKENLRIPKNLKASGDKWMFQYNPGAGTVCVFIDRRHPCGAGEACSTGDYRQHRRRSRARRPARFYRV